MHRTFRLSLALVGLVAASAPASLLAQDQNLPSADDLIATHVELTNGASLWGVEGAISRGQFSLPAFGLQGSITIATRAPNQQRMEIELPGLGTLQQGFDGEVGWSVNPLSGAQIAGAAESAQLREQSSHAASLRDPSVVPGRETVASAMSRGEVCWRVRLTWASGTVTHDCYSKESGLLIETETMQRTEMGEVASITRYLDYQDVAGGLRPMRLQQSAGGQDTEIRMQSISIEAVSDAQVAAPEVIQNMKTAGGER
jgi:hypothetical protein